MMAIYKDVEPLEFVAYKGESEEFDKGVTFILEKLDTLPTADVAEVKRGYWKGKPIAGYSDIRCSVCNTRFVQETGTWAYCPECGAKMDGGKT